jgi:hypothetical protein
MMTFKAVADLTVGSVVRVQSTDVTVTSVEHDVAYYSRRVTMVHGVDSNGVLWDVVCDPNFEFELAN